MAGLVGIYSPNWYNSIPLQPSIYFPNYILFLTGSTILNIVTGHYYCPVCLVGHSLVHPQNYFVRLGHTESQLTKGVLLVLYIRNPFKRT